MAAPEAVIENRSRIAEVWTSTTGGSGGASLADAAADAGAGADAGVPGADADAAGADGGAAAMAVVDAGARGGAAGSPEEQAATSVAIEQSQPRVFIPLIPPRTLIT
ncbi:hypothetical protein [Sorangium sp. So ce1099]|uniref:hypothetical protein n=1 Tax=Sorangium sp. So ce1099 TaxID=3133331 RepID=UPI003F631079